MPADSGLKSGPEPSRVTVEDYIAGKAIRFWGYSELDRQTGDLRGLVTTIPNVRTISASGCTARLSSSLKRREQRRPTSAPWRLLLAAAVSVMLVSVSLLAFVSPSDGTRAGSTKTSLIDQILDLAVNYLVDNYNNSNINSPGLIRESPDDSNTSLHNRSWVYSDNYLASHALQTNHSKGNSTLSGMAENITMKMKYYLDLKGITDPVNSYMALFEPMTVFHASDPNGTDLTPDGVVNYTIMAHIHDWPGILHPEDYADIAFLTAVGRLNSGSHIDSLAAYTIGVNRWDGWGFDQESNGNYPTYKLALYIYASKLLNRSYHQEAWDTLLAMQQHSGLAIGGFTGYYDSLLRRVGSTNAETTSLAILALDPPPPVSGIPEFESALVPIIFVLAIVILISRKRKAV